MLTGEGMVTARRKHDAVFAVCQENDKHQIRIKKINQGAEYLSGYRSAEIEGKTLSDIVPSQIQDALESYIEYDDPAGDDLAAVLKRTRFFQVTNKDGENIPINLKVFPVPGTDKNSHYELLMRDITLLERLKIMKAQMVEEQDANAYVDNMTGLPNITALRRYIEILLSYVKTNHIEATFALIDVESYYDVAEKYGVAEAAQMVKAVGERYRSAARAEDSIGYINEGIMGVLLFDCSSQSAPAAFGRIKNRLTDKPVEISTVGLVPVRVNITYHQINENDMVDGIIRLCAEVLDRSAKAGGNDMVEA